MKIIQSGVIEAWASRSEARDAFPAMIRKLIRFTTNATLEGFHAYNENNRPGVDGKTVLEAQGNSWVPCGVAYWEIGVVKDNQRKAENDYKKRTNKDYERRTEAIDEEDRRAATFVYVTSKNWRGGDAWAQEKRQLKEWKDVRVIDAESIEQWIEQLCYHQLARIADNMGISISGIGLLESEWKIWTNATVPPLPQWLFNTDVQRAIKSPVWQKWKRGEETSRVVELRAESIGEALAFLYCLFKSDEFKQFEDRAFVARCLDVLERGIDEENNVVIVVDGALSTQLVPKKEGVRGIYIRKGCNFCNRNSFALSNLDEWSAAQIMREIGQQNDSMKFIRDFSGKSRSVFRRRLSENPCVYPPRWSEDLDLFSDLIPLICFNSWNSSSEVQGSLMCELFFDDYHKTLNKYIKRDDSPVREDNGVYSIVSLTEVIFYFTKVGNDSDLKKLIERLYFIILNVQDKYLRESAYHSLIILDSYREYCKTHVQELIFKTIQLIFNCKLGGEVIEYGNVWSELTLLAELAPELTLGFISKKLADNKNGAIEPLVLQEIVAATKILAFHSEYFSRCIDNSILLLKCILADGELELVESMLKSFFCSWLPQTNASVHGRNKELAKLFVAFPELAWRVALEQVDPYPQTGTRNKTAIWRNSSKWQRIRAVTYGEVRETFRFSYDKVLEFLSPRNKQIIRLLLFTLRYSSDQARRLWIRLQEIAMCADDKDKANVQEAIMHFKWCATLRGKNSERYANLLKLAEQTLSFYIPKSGVLRYAWVLSWDCYQLVSAGHQNRRSHSRECEIITYLRKRLFRSSNVVSQEFISELLDLDKLDAFPVGVELSKYIDNEDDLISVVKYIIYDDKRKISNGCSMFIKGLLHSLTAIACKDLISYASVNLAEEDVKFILTNLPCRKEIWNTLASISSVLEDEYWKNVDLSQHDVKKDDDNIILNRFLQNGRYFWILNIITFIHEEKYTNIRRKLLRLIYEKQLQNPHIVNYRNEYLMGELVSSIAPLLSDFEKFKLGVRFLSDLSGVSAIYLPYFSFVSAHADLFVRTYRHYFIDKSAGMISYACESNLKSIFCSTPFLRYLHENGDVMRWVDEVMAHSAMYETDFSYVRHVHNQIGIFIAQILVHDEVFAPLSLRLYDYLNDKNNLAVRGGFIYGVQILQKEKHHYEYGRDKAICDAERYRELADTIRREYPQFADMLDDISDNLTSVEE